jgi:hypothetical protein
LPLSAALHQPKKNSLPVFHVGGIPLSMHHTQCADFDCKNFDSPFGLPQDDTQTRPRTTDLPSHRSFKNDLSFLMSAKRYHA